MQKVMALCLILSIATTAIARGQIRKRSPIEKQVLELQRDLNDAQIEKQLIALDQLGKLARDMRFTTSTIAILLEHKNPDIRSRAVETLTQFGPIDNATAIDYVKKALMKENDDEVLRRLIGLTYTMRPFGNDMLPLILKHAQHKNVKIRRQVVRILHNFTDHADQTVPVLIKALDDPDTDIPGKQASVAWYAVIELGKIGPPAKDAATAVMRIAESKIVQRRIRALVTLAKIVPKDKRLIALFTKKLQTADPLSVRGAAAMALGELGPRGKEAIPVLLKTAQFQDKTDKEGAEWLRFNSIQALANMGPDAKKAIPVIREALASDPSGAVRTAAQWALKKLEQAK